MTLPKIETYSDEKLADLLNAVLNEQERRQRLAQAPGQIAALAQRFLDEGGNPAELVLPTEPTPVEVPGEVVETNVPPGELEQVNGFAPEQGDEVPLEP